MDRLKAEIHRLKGEIEMEKEIRPLQGRGISSLGSFIRGFHPRFRLGGRSIEKFDPYRGLRFGTCDESEIRPRSGQTSL